VSDPSFRLGEKQRALVSGVLHRPSAWTASRVGGRVTKINELRRNPRNGALLHHRFALIPLGQVHSAHLLYRSETGQEYVRQHLRTAGQRAVDLQ
jgi:hypothetical protein